MVFIVELRTLLRMRRNVGLDGGFVAVGTLLAGIVPFLVLAARSNTLWFTARCDVPLFAVPSVWLGDLLFLPVLNYRIYRFLNSLRSTSECLPSRSLTAAVTSAIFITSLSINGYLHYSWTQDAYLGFIDPTPGRLAPVGWWHCAFSVAESTILVVFLVLWLRSFTCIGAKIAESGFSIWKVFVWYSWLSILDFGVNHVIILPRHPEVEYSWAKGWQALLVIPFSLSTLQYARALQQRRVQMRIGQVRQF